MSALPDKTEAGGPHFTRSRFRRRYYSRPGAFTADIRALLSHRRQIRRAMRELIARDFRERLMMVVTQVNGCRYCRVYHSRQALSCGVSQTELRDLLAGSIPAGAPDEELPAVLYAQHWAQNDAHPNPKADAHLDEVYGSERADAIRIVRRMIRVGNLAGNAADYLLWRLTLGRCGLQKEERGRD